MAEETRWNVEITDEYFEWYQTLDAPTQDALVADIELIEKKGPSLGRPYVDTVKGSNIPT
jgi:hypothetical protein